MTWQNGLQFDAQGNLLCSIGGLSAPYLGFIATRGHAPTTYNAGAKNSMSRSRHIAMDNIAAIQLVLPGWYVQASGETAVGANLTYTASIEYPVGVTVTRVSFAGATSGICTPGTTLTSDLITLPAAITRGASFFVRIFMTTAGGIPFSQAVGLNTPTSAVPASGEWWNLSAGAVTDDTGTLTNQNNTVAANAGMQVPLALLGYTSRNSLLIVGDSRTIGPQVQENVCNAVGDTGNVARSAGRRYAYCGVGAGGEQLAGVASGASFALRLALAPYCTHVICAYGINDFQTGGLSAATTLTNLATFAARFVPQKPLIVCTVEPNTTSTDGWGTVANQAQVSSSANTQRILYNDSLRRGNYVTPIVRTADVTSAVESGINSGTWSAAERSAADCSITSGAAVLTSVTLANFTPDDVGKYVGVVGAGAAAATLVTYIKTYTSATSVTLNANAGTTVAAGTAYIGTPTSDGIHGTSISSGRIERSTVFDVLQGL